MRFSRELLVREAEATGFRPEILEKVFQLLHLLESLLSHPYLRERIVLKGDTALNLFYFDVPRQKPTSFIEPKPNAVEAVLTSG